MEMSIFITVSVEGRVPVPGGGGAEQPVRHLSAESGTTNHVTRSLKV